MDSLAVEVLELILSHLDEEDLDAAERVCSHWSHVVVARFWWPALQSFACSDHHLRGVMLREGFVPEASWNYAANRRIFVKIRSAWECNWRKEPLSRQDHVLRKCSASDFVSFKISCVLPLGKKLFLALERGAIEVWSLEGDSILYQSTLYDGEQGDEGLGYLPRGYSLDLWNTTLAAIDCPRRKILVFDAAGEKKVGEVSPPLGNLYAVGVTSTLLVCLSGWHLVAWEYEVLNGQLHLKPPFVASDFTAPLAEDMTWLDMHYLEKNEEYVVTMPSARSASAQSSKSSLVRVRRCGNLNDSFTLLSRSGEEEISRIKLSASNLLAVLEFLSNGTRLSVYNVDTRDVVFSLPSFSSPLALVHLPVQWVGSRLFFKRVPHDNEEDVSLMAADLKDNSTTFQVSDLKMRTPNDLLHLTNFRAIHLFNNFPQSAVGEAQEFQIRLALLNFL